MATTRPLPLVKATFTSFLADEATWKAAALAYYTVFALAPLLVLLLQIASLIWDPVEVRRALTVEFGSLMGQDVARQIETMVASAEEKASTTGVRLLLSLAGLAFGATGAFVSLQTALNQAWRVEPDPKRGGIKNFITKRVLSLGMVLGIAFLVLVSLALSAALSAAGDVLFGGLGEAVGHVLNFVLSFAVITLLFAAMFKVLPDAKVAWRDVWVGAVATSVFFVVGKYLIGLYIGQSDPGNTFGAAGALAVLLVWIYYAAVIVLLGAEFTQAWMRQHGREIEPEKGAVRVIERKQHVDPSGGIRPAHPRADERDTARGTKTPERRTDVESARRRVAETRERMAHTVAAIEARVSGTVSYAKQRFDAAEFVRRHPWPALAAAVVAGVTLSATRVDEKAASATVDATKRVARTVTDRTVTDDASDLAHAAATKLHGDDNDKAATHQRDGFVGRTRSTISDFARAQAGELESELRRAATELPR